MKNYIKRVSLVSTVLVLAALVSVFVFSPTARAETTQCTPITTIPTTITTQGIYCLNGNLAGSLATGKAITIDTNNVTIDMNGYKLGNLGAGPGTNAWGIYAYQRKNITIRNGIIRGFYYGIGLNDDPPYTTSSGHLIEDVRLDGNIYMGIGILGSGNTARNNQVINTGTSANAYGIYAAGLGARVLNNDVTDTEGSGTAYAVFLDYSAGSVVEGNRISNVISSGSYAYGVSLSGSSGSVVEGNRISNVSPGGGGSATGIQLSTGSNNVTVSDNRIAGVVNNGIFYITSSTGIYMNNTVSGVPTPFFGGTPAGTTNHSN